MKSKKEENPYPYAASQEYSLNELDEIIKKASLRGFNVFQDYNFIIFNLATHLKNRKINEECCDD